MTGPGAGRTRVARPASPPTPGALTSEAAADRSALTAALAALRCPVCRGRLARSGQQLRCELGHGFDIARQGYVNLTAGGGPAANADSADMIAARSRFLDRGHYAPVAAALGALAGRLGPAAPGVVLDLAGGTGYYLAAVLGSGPGRAGICLDRSKPALRRAAAAHPRAAAVGADVWRELPLADGSAAIILSVFGPRNPGEIRRVLGAGGVFLLVTPAGPHLGEVIAPLGMLSVDAAKADRLAASLSGFEQVAAETLTYVLPLAHASLRDLVGMGPSAHHVDPAGLDHRIAALPDPQPVTVAVTLAAYRAMPEHGGQ
jgi:23S rRNA (guanine745-N1)-methyltransferase